MKIPYSGLSVSGIIVALSSALYLGQSTRPFDVVIVRFCPTTINKGQRHIKNRADSQAELDRKYCRYEHKLLKEVWEQQQFEASLPIPESSLQLRNIPKTKSDVKWFIIAPISFGLGYLAWSKKCEINEENAHWELEGYKTSIKLTGVRARNERDFKTQTINSNWDKQRVKSGFIPVDAIKDRAKKQAEIQDKTHASALKQLDLADSEMDKTIAENIRDKNKADKESEKMLSKAFDDNISPTNTSDAVKKSITSALKSWEDGWLYDMIIGLKPILIYGDMGSYKSYTAACLAILKTYLQNAKIISICDPQFHQNQDESWRYLTNEEVNIYGTKYNYEEYGQGISDFITRCGERNLKSKPLISIWDELTLVGKKIPSQADELMPFIISAPRKARENTIAITHSLTNAGLGGVEGFSESIKSGCLTLELKSDNQNKPLFKGVLNGYKDAEGTVLKDHPVSLPKWFRDDLIHNHFNGQPIDFDR